MLGAALTLRATRVLVVAPSKLLREQLAGAFRTLEILKKVGALETGRPALRVTEARSKIATDNMWGAMTTFDVVVGTPSALSPAVSGVVPPPEGLFDVVLFDEAHHVPARTYRALSEAFPSARQVFFTATPFRRDEKEIRADLVFTYELAHAQRDGVFGTLRYVPVTPAAAQSNDEAIARAASARLRSDRKNGHDHLIFVRTSSTVRADALAKVYEKHTQLRLLRIHSGVSDSQIRDALGKLRSGAADGVIAVDMLGEGFDLPQLKVAALHAPHRSLAVTLQFIGRFARTSGERLGEATFFAVDSEIAGEAARLFVPGAEWNEIVKDLSHQRAADEELARATIASFQEPQAAASAPVGLASEVQKAILWSIQPYFHAKVFEVTDDVDLTSGVVLPAGMDPIVSQYSAQERAFVCIGRSESGVRWSRHESLVNVSYHLFVVVHLPSQRLLFACTSLRSDGVHDAIVQQLSAAARRLAPNEVNRVLRGLENQELFSVGMRNRAGVGGGGAESYRIMAGRSADKAIRIGDASLYDQGHAFCRGEEGGETVTIGFSSSSKIWANRKDRIGELLEWLKAIASKLRDSSERTAASMFDRLGQARRIEKIPERVIAADLPYEAYLRPALRIRTGVAETWLVDCRVVVGPQTATEVKFIVQFAETSLRFVLNLGRRPLIAAEDELSEHALLTDESGGHEQTLLQYLNDDYPIFYLETLAVVAGDTLTDAPSVDGVDVSSQVEGVDWLAEGVDPLREKPSGKSAVDGCHERSLFEYVVQRAQGEGTEVLFFDDSSNEIADYVAVKRSVERTVVQLIHCKAAGRMPVPGDRVQDMFEVLGQAIKCRRWQDARRLLAQVRHRESKTGSHFVVGNVGVLAELLEGVERLQFEVVVVQPGLSTAPKGTIKDLLIAADAYQRGAHQLPMRFIGTDPATRADN